MERKMMFVGTCVLALIVALAICVPAAFADEPATKASGVSEVGASATLATEASASVANGPAAKSVEGTMGSGSGTAAPNEETYSVSYQFQNVPAYRPLPQEIKDMLPVMKSGVANGTKVIPPTLALAKVRANNGIWHFKGWDKSETTVNGKNVTFTGKWVLDQYKALFASYSFVPSIVSQKAGYTTLPVEVLDLLPPPSEGLKNGAILNHPQLDKTEVKVDGGKWVFNGWPAGNTQIVQGNTLTTGAWTFVKAAPIPKADRVDLAVHLNVNGKRTYPTAEMLSKMKPALIASDGTRVEPVGIASNGFIFNFKDVPEGEYTLEFSMLQGYRFLAGDTASMGAYINSGDKIKVTAGTVAQNFYTQLELIPIAPDTGDQNIDQGNQLKPETPSVQNPQAQSNDTKQLVKTQVQLKHAKSLPKTGDDTGVAVMGLTGAAAVAGLTLALAGLVLARRKSRR